MTGRGFMLGTALLSLAVCGSAEAAEPEAVVAFEIVVHPDLGIESVTRAELSKIFLKRLRTWENGTEARPVDQLPESPIRSAFSRRIHRRSVVSIEVYWQGRTLSGRSFRPDELASDEEVIDYVRRTPGAVGYVTSAAEFEGVEELKLEE